MAQRNSFACQPITTSAALRAHRQSAGASAPRETRGASLALEAAAGTSHHGRALKDRGL